MVGLGPKKPPARKGTGTYASSFSSASLVAPPREYRALLCALPHSTPIGLAEGLHNAAAWPPEWRLPSTESGLLRNPTGREGRQFGSSLFALLCFCSLIGYHGGQRRENGVPSGLPTYLPIYCAYPEIPSRYHLCVLPWHYLIPSPTPLVLPFPHFCVPLALATQLKQAQTFICLTTGFFCLIPCLPTWIRHSRSLGAAEIAILPDWARAHATCTLLRPTLPKGAEWAVGDKRDTVLEETAPSILWPSLPWSRLDWIKTALFDCITTYLHTPHFGSSLKGYLASCRATAPGAATVRKKEKT